MNALGAVHVACNNAGVADTSGAAVWEASLEDWQWVVGVNLWGVVPGIRTFVPILLRQEEGYVGERLAQLGFLLHGQVGLDELGVAGHNFEFSQHSVLNPRRGLLRALRIDDEGAIQRFDQLLTLQALQLRGRFRRHRPCRTSRRSVRS
jgi:hypothetical protein